MKNTTLIIALLLFSSCLSAQNYLNETSTWQEFDICAAESQNAIATTIRLDGDTLINGINYHKTYVTGRSISSSYSDTVIIELSPYYANPIREEAGAFYQNINGEDQILHNFNLSVGDSVVVRYGNNTVTVASIDTVFIGNIPRKRFMLDVPVVEQFLIEGVGSSMGLFKKPFDGFFIDCSETLQCFSQSNQYLQLDTDAECSGVVNIDDAQNPDFSFLITPNPTQNHLNITFDRILPNNTHLQITSIDGKTLLQKNISNVQQINNLNISQLPDGVLIISVLGDDILHSKRIIKME